MIMAIFVSFQILSLKSGHKHTFSWTIINCGLQSVLTLKGHMLGGVLHTGVCLQQVLPYKILKTMWPDPWMSKRQQDIVCFQCQVPVSCQINLPAKRSYTTVMTTGVSHCCCQNFWERKLDLNLNNPSYIYIAAWYQQ